MPVITPNTPRSIASMYAPAYQPPRPAPVAQPQPQPAPQPAAPAPQKKECNDMENKQLALRNHRHSRAAEILEIAKVVSYIASPIVLAIGQSVKGPNTPPVNSTQPAWLIAENQNRYEANKAAWESRKTLWTNVGQALLTFGSSGLSARDREEIADIVRMAMAAKK